MKIRILAVLIIGVLLMGCELQPAPEAAIKACVDKGWSVHYKSTSSIVEFECAPPEEVSNGLFKK